MVHPAETAHDRLPLADKAEVRPTEEASVAAYNAFVQRHSARLIQSLTLAVLDYDLAADAAQDAFLRLYQHWDAVQRYQEPVAWLYRVGINRCKDYRRYFLRAGKLVDRLVASMPPPADLGDWDGRLDAKALLGGLPMRQRTAAALFFEADLSIAQIATAMNLSEGAVKSHLSRARKSLRRHLEAE